MVLQKAVFMISGQGSRQEVARRESREGPERSQGRLETLSRQCRRGLDTVTLSRRSQGGAWGENYPAVHRNYIKERSLSFEVTLKKLINPSLKCIKMC